MEIRAEYLGESDTGVKVHSKFLTNCDARSLFDQFKAHSISKEQAPFFIDLFDEATSTIVDTVGVGEQTYSDITGEVVMSYEYYQRESDFKQDLIFGAIEKSLREKGVEMPWNEKESIGFSAQKLHKFRQSDHVLLEANVDNLEIKR